MNISDGVLLALVVVLSVGLPLWGSWIERRAIRGFFAEVRRQCRRTTDL